MALFENFPYTNIHELNLDWIVKIAKDFLEQYTHIQQLIEEGETSLVNLKETGLAELQEKADALEELLQQWYNTHSDEIADQLADALEDLSTATATALQNFNISAERKAQETIASIPASYTELANAVAALNKLFVPGINIYNNEGTQIDKALVNGTGAEKTLTGAYLSNYIEVDPNIEYYISKAIGSLSAHPTLACYDQNKTYISQLFREPVGGYTFTTPSNAKYVRLTWLSENGNTIDIERTPTFNNAVLNTNTMSAYASPTAKIFSDGQISYNRSTGYITSTTNIILNFGITNKNYGNSYYVGIGDILYFNSKTKTLHAETDFILSPYEYLIAIFTANELIPTLTPNNCILSAFKVIEYDEITGTVSFNVRAQPAFLIFNNYVYRLNAGTSYSFNLTEDVAYVYYDTSTGEFIKSTDYTTLRRTRGCVLFNKYFWNYWSIEEPITKINNAGWKRAVCFGDSLTWYDGNVFDWGDLEGQTCVGFESYLLRYFNMREVVNQGRSGYTTPQIAATIRAYTGLDNMDYVFIMTGDNDDRLNVEIGTPAAIGSTFNTSTVYGALQSAIEYLLTVKPNIRIILMTEPQGFTYRTDGFYPIDPAIPEAIRNIGKIYNIPVIDLYAESGINELTRNTFYNDPPTNNLYMYHPNNLGWERLSRIIVQHFNVLK